MLARNSSSARRPASSPVMMMARSRSSQSVDRGRCGSVDTAASRAVTDSGGRDLGSDLGCLGRPIIGIGLAGISSAVNRKVHSTFQVDQQRRIEAASWVRAYSANAERSASVPMIASGRRTRSWVSPANRAAIASKSWR